MWRLLADGQTEFATGKSIHVADVDDYIKLLRFVFEHIDGKPRTQVELSGEDGGPIGLRMVEVLLEPGLLEDGSDAENESE